MKFRVISLILLLCLVLCACNSASDPVITDPANTPSATNPQATDPEPAVQVTDPDTGIPSLTVTPEGTTDPDEILDDIWGELWGDEPIVLPDVEFTEDDENTSSNITEPDETEPSDVTQDTTVSPSVPTEDPRYDDGDVLPEITFEP